MGWVSTVNPFQRRRGCTEKKAGLGRDGLGPLFAQKAYDLIRLRDKFFEVLNML